MTKARLAVDLEMTVRRLCPELLQCLALAVDVGVLLIVTASCSSSATAPAAIAIADLPAALAHLLCDYPCGDPNPTAGRELCLQAVEREGLRQRMQLVELHQGIAYDSLAAGQCLAGATCDNARAVADELNMYLVNATSMHGVPAACANVFTGQLPLLSRCQDDAQCATGRCWGVTDPVCVQPAATGADCGAALPCAEGDLCPSAKQPKCEPVATLPDGTTCADSNLGNLNVSVLCGGVWCATFLNVCNDMFCSVPNCSAISYCKVDAPPFGTCEPRLLNGDACQQGDSCVAGASCRSSICTTDPPPPTGEPCGVDGKTHCLGSEYCDSNQVCTKFAHSGESCVGGKRCSESVCLASTTGLCSNGNPCGPTCDVLGCQENGQCTTPRIGDACTKDGDCNEPYQPLPILNCIDGTCQRRWNPARTW